MMMELVHAVPVILIARGAHVQQAHEVVPELVLDPPVSRPHVEIHLIPQIAEIEAVQFASCHIARPHRIDEGLFLAALPPALPRTNRLAPVLLIEHVHPLLRSLNRRTKTERIPWIIAPQWLLAQVAMARTDHLLVAALGAPICGHVEDARATTCGELLAIVVVLVAWCAAIACIVSRIVPERTKGRVAARAARTGRRGAVRHGCALGLAP
mmetsp:Transcript_21413/g.56453  ORF Transcript_21413/g.56453 Transcript_21413/m.56453 type:complete len:211 (-) Transcript_21413:284-916(-)